MKTNKLKRFVKVAGFVSLALLISLIVLNIVLDEGIPFLEGDDRVVSGRGYGFEIGMTKKETFEVIKDSYNINEYFLRVLWLKDSEINNELERFENTEWAEYKNRKYSEYKVQINNLTEITLPLDYGKRWDIKMPSDWVNTIYLTFENNCLVEIMRSRWLFERP
jgi:hypothetical protein